MGALVLAALFLGGTAVKAELPHEILPFAALSGWAEAQPAAALSVFRQTCDLAEGPEWGPLCALAAEVPEGEASAKAFFEIFFRPVVFGKGPALFTGYYEPELEAALAPGGRFRYPIYARPGDLVEGQPYLTRAAIDGGALAGRGLEIAWLDDPVDVYFLQVQGSGRLRLPDGQVLRVGYGGKNGHSYRSLGQALIDQGALAASEASAPVIQEWVRANGAAGQAALGYNPSYVFFRVLKDLPPEKGPLGALGRPITGGLSAAVDPAFTPLGAPIWVEKDGADPLRRLMVAQDTGGAIKGPQRADLFYGTGAAAVAAAGVVKDPGRLVVLLPIERALALSEE